MEKPDQKAYFAEYITAFDIPEPTEWWFTIKDDAYDLSKLKSQERRNVKVFSKYCYAKRIKPTDFTKDLFEVFVKSFSAYPEKYRPKQFAFEKFSSDIENWAQKPFFVYAAFTNEENTLIGFTLMEHKNKAVKLVMQKTNPAYEKYRSNAALVDCMLNDWNEKLKAGEVYVTNGSRSIKHETNFNAYLEKYFGFRKAYAKLRIVYRFPFGIIVKILKPFRKFFEHTENSLLYNLYCVLKMDSFASK